MTIGDRLAPGATRIPVRNPATGEVFAEAPAAAAADLDAAVAAARTVFPAWRALGPEGRRGLIVAAAKTLRANLDELAALLTAEQGKPLAEARDEILGGYFWLAETSKLSLDPVVCLEDAQRRVERRFPPIGVVGAIVPWNFPVLLAMFKLAPALYAGNCVVVKPSPFTPLTMLRIGALFQQILPPGVVNVVSGDDALGPLMTEHAGIDKISFTGSTETGRRVMAGAAANLKRLTLELGGNDAAIILPDAPVAEIAPKLFWAAMRNNGQLCIAAKRLYVHADIFEPFAEAMLDYARTIRIGNGAEESTQIGPLQNQRQAQRIDALLAQSRGLCTIGVGAETLPKQGYFRPITFVIDPPDDALVVTQEQFGPIVPLLKFSDEAEALARANASPFGLAGSVWSADLERAHRVAAALDTGTVWINEAHFMSPLAPFSGVRQSGLGVENGAEGLKEFTAPKTVVMAKAQA